MELLMQYSVNANFSGKKETRIESSALKHFDIRSQIQNIM